MSDSPMRKVPPSQAGVRELDDVHGSEPRDEPDVDGEALGAGNGNSPQHDRRPVDWYETIR